MKQNKNKILNKWKPIIESLDLSEDKKNWLEEYAELHHNAEYNFDFPINNLDLSSGDTKNLYFPTTPIVPLAQKIAAQTIGLDLVTVHPIGTKPGKSEKQKLRESRLNKLRSLKGEEPNVVLPNDITVYDSPTPALFYLDFVYTSSGNTQNNI